MKRLPILFVFATFALCNLFSVRGPATKVSAPVAAPTETYAPVVTPTMIPMLETAPPPLTTVQGAGEWIVQDDSNVSVLDPSGATPGFSFQIPLQPTSYFVLARNGIIYSLSDDGNGSFALERVYPQEHPLGVLAARRNIMVNLHVSPIFSSDGSSLIWSRADEDGTMTRTLFVTSLETGESREIWHTELPPEAKDHALVPLFYDSTKQTLVYALHTFYSGMTSTQVASLYIADLTANKITPLWALNPNEMHGGVSATVSPDENLLAYLTWGNPQADFTLPWTLHLRDLSSGKETTYRLNETWENAEVHFFSPDEKQLLLVVSRHIKDGDIQTEMLVFNLDSKTWKNIFTMSSDLDFVPRAWSDGNWLILTNENDNYSTWVMRPDGSALTQITPLEWTELFKP